MSDWDHTAELNHDELNALIHTVEESFSDDPDLRSALTTLTAIPPGDSARITVTDGD